MKVKAEERTLQNPLSSALAFIFSKEFLLFGNLTVGICTASAAAGGFYFSKVSFNLPCLIFIFCSTIFVYNLDRLSISKADLINSPERSCWIKSSFLQINILNVLLISASLWQLAFYSNLKSTLLSCLLLLICFLYNLFLKRWPGMKNITVAATWSITVTALPAWWTDGSVNVNYAIFCFAAAFSNTLLFDLRDRIGDLQEKVYSLAVLLSEKSCRNIFKFSVLITLGLSLYYQFFLLSVIPLLTLFLAFKAKESSVKYLLIDLVLATPVLAYLQA